MEGDRVARITHVTLVDDIDGSHASETVFFSLDGRHYDIDLSAENAATLRTRLPPSWPPPDEAPALDNRGRPAPTTARLR